MADLTSRDGTVLAYDKSGEGPPLILVDGAMTTRGGETRPELVALLAPHFTVYGYDRRGRGESTDTAPYAVGREIDDLASLIDDAGGAAFLYGHSSGGCLALEAAATLGPKVSKVAVYEAPWNDDPEWQKAWAEYLHGLREALAAGRRGDAVALFMEFVGTPPEQIAGMRHAPFWPSLEAIAPTLAYDHAEIMGPTGAVPTETLGRVTAPVLAICGDAGFPYMCATARTIADAVQHGAARTLHDESHAVAPAALAPVLIEFLGEKAGGAREEHAA